MIVVTAIADALYQGYIQTENGSIQTLWVLKKCPQKRRREKENRCFLIHFSSKQRTSLHFVQKNILYS